MDDLQFKQIETWYDSNYKAYDSFCNEMRSIIEKIIRVEKIPFHSITCRTKSKDSFLDKCKNKNYDNPSQQLTDFAGVRIIAYINADVDLICNIIEKEFEIDPENSINKANSMKQDQVGYLSVHYIVKLNTNRGNLSENKLFKDLYFEIQVRTLLQHAWAEIEHDRNYKFGGVLPPEIQRRFFLAAGTLELVDREFQCLSDDIDKYSTEVRNNTTHGNLNILIDSTSLMEYMRTKFDEDWVEPTFRKSDRAIIEELRRFGITTLQDIEKMIPTDFKEYCKNINIDPTNFIGVLRDLMIINDYKKYFKYCWNNDWNGLDIDSMKIYEHYKLPVDTFMHDYGLSYDYGIETDIDYE